MCPPHPQPLPPTSLPPPTAPYPSGLSQSSGVGFPVSHIKLTLVIYFTYGNIPVSVLFSEIIPPSPWQADSLPLSHQRRPSGGESELILTTMKRIESTQYYVIVVFLFLE